MPQWTQDTLDIIFLGILLRENCCQHCVGKARQIVTKTEKEALAAKKRVKAWALCRNWLLYGSMGMIFYAAAPIGLVV